MKRTILLAVVSVSLASPALAQSRVYTNADLGKPLNRTHTPTVEEMQGLVARQFTASVRRDEPQVVVLPYDPVWPFTQSQRLELDPWRMPGGWPLYGPWGPSGFWYSPYVTYPAPTPTGWYQSAAPRYGYRSGGGPWRASTTSVAPASAAPRAFSSSRGAPAPGARR